MTVIAQEEKVLAVHIDLSTIKKKKEREQVSFYQYEVRLPISKPKVGSAYVESNVINSSKTQTSNQ